MLARATARAAGCARVEAAQLLANIGRLRATCNSNAREAHAHNARQINRPARSSAGWLSLPSLPAVRRPPVATKSNRPDQRPLPGQSGASSSPDRRLINSPKGSASAVACISSGRCARLASLPETRALGSARQHKLEACAHDETAATTKLDCRSRRHRRRPKRDLNRCEALFRWWSLCFWPPLRFATLSRRPAAWAAGAQLVSQPAGRIASLLLTLRAALC